MTGLTTADIEALTTIAQAQLAVCAAAKAERRHSLLLVDPRLTGKPFDRAIDVWSQACRDLDAAVDTLIELEAAE